MKLFCSDQNSFQLAGVRYIFSASSFGLVYNHGKLGILNYHKDLVLQWLKGRKQVREDFNRIQQTCHFQLNAR